MAALNALDVLGLLTSLVDRLTGLDGDCSASVALTTKPSDVRPLGDDGVVGDTGLVGAAPAVTTADERSGANACLPDDDDNTDGRTRDVVCVANDVVLGT